MPEGNSPFLVMLDYTGNGDVETALGTLHNDASLLVNGQEVGIPTTAFNVKEGFVTLFSSTPDDLEAAGLSIELVYDNEKLVVR
jgi:hypothetical protein